MKITKFLLIIMVPALLVSCQKKETNEQVVQKLEKNIGLQMYSLRDNIGKSSENVAAMIEEIGKMGYKYVETANYWDGLIYNYTPADFKAKLDENGLWAVSCHVRQDMWEKESDKAAIWTSRRYSTAWINRGLSI